MSCRPPHRWLEPIPWMARDSGRHGDLKQGTSQFQRARPGGQLVLNPLDERGQGVERESPLDLGVMGVDDGPDRHGKS